MTSNETAVAVIDALGALAVPHMLVGSFASNVYGIPRSTQDADFVVQLGDTPLAAVLQHLGPEFRLDPQMSFEMVTGTTRQVLRVRGSPFQVELFHLSDDPHDQERFARRRGFRILDRDTFIPSAEDMIVTKLRWAQYGQRPKDHEDARNMIAVQEKSVDWDYVTGWCDRHGTRELLDRIRQSIPPA